MNYAKLTVNVIYGIGVCITLVLLYICFFGSDEIINPEAMLPCSWRVQAFMFLVGGSMPMLLACWAVYRYNEIKSSQHSRRNMFLVFLPGFVCGVCLLYVIGIMILGYIKMIAYNVFGYNLF